MQEPATRKFPNALDAELPIVGAVAAVAIATVVLPERPDPSGLAAAAVAIGAAGLLVLRPLVHYPLPDVEAARDEDREPLTPLPGLRVGIGLISVSGAFWAVLDSVPVARGSVSGALDGRTIVLAAAVAWALIVAALVLRQPPAPSAADAAIVRVRPIATLLVAVANLIVIVVLAKEASWDQAFVVTASAALATLVAISVLGNSASLHRARLAASAWVLVASAAATTGVAGTCAMTTAIHTGERPVRPLEAFVTAAGIAILAAVIVVLTGVLLIRARAVPQLTPGSPTVNLAMDVGLGYLVILAFGALPIWVASRLGAAPPDDPWLVWIPFALPLLAAVGFVGWAIANSFGHLAVQSRKSVMDDEEAERDRLRLLARHLYRQAAAAVTTVALSLGAAIEVIV